MINEAREQFRGSLEFVCGFARAHVLRDVVPGGSPSLPVVFDVDKTRGSGILSPEMASRVCCWASETAQPAVKSTKLQTASEPMIRTQGSGLRKVQSYELRSPLKDSGLGVRFHVPIITYRPP